MGMRTRTLAVEASSGAYLVVRATGNCRRVSVREVEALTGTDGTFTGTGLNFKLPTDNFTAIIGVLAAEEPFLIEDFVPQGNAGGRALGFPAIPIPGGETKPADILFKVISAGNATNIAVTEYD